MSDLHAAPLEDEPRTPMWLPALGAALFVGAGLWWAVTPAAVPVVAEPAPSASAPVAPSATAVPVAPAEPPPAPVRSAPPSSDVRPPLGAPPGGPAADDRMRRLRQQLQLKGAGGQP
jgi:hypothetical protein